MKEVKTRQARQEIKDPVVDYIKLDTLKELLAMAEADGAENFYIANDWGDPGERLWATWAWRDRTTGRLKERWFKLDIGDGFCLFRIDKYMDKW